jgi:hypothetical protein
VAQGTGPEFEPQYQTHKQVLDRFVMTTLNGHLHHMKKSNVLWISTYTRTYEKKWKDKQF